MPNMDTPQPASQPGALWTSASLADRLGAELVGPPDLPLTRLDTLDRADERTVTFIRDARYAARWADSRAGAAIVTRGLSPAAHDPARRALLVVEDADRALIGVLESLAPVHESPTGSHPTAVIDPTARVDATARLGPGCVIGPRARVGARTILHAHVSLGADVAVGADCDLRAGVVVEDGCSLGARVIIHPNTVIGADGFGYRPAPHAGAGLNGAPALLKIPHAGAVEIGDDVEIGACTAIDRGKFGPTVVGSGAKIDNLVQIGHNCRIGKNCVICGATGLAGSVTVGDGVTIGGGVGVKDNVTIGAGATIAARAAVMDDVPAGETWAGYPAQPWKVTMRVVAATMKLPELLKRLQTERAAGRSEQRP